MQFLVDKDGSLSPFRLSIFGGIIGLIVLAGSIVGFFIDQESRKAPFYPPVPNGAETWGFPEIFSDYRQDVYYRVRGGDISTIVDFYQDQMLAHYGNSANDPNAEQCQRFPKTGTFADPQVNSFGENIQVAFDPATQPAFRYTCMFDRGGFNTSQWTEVTIYPGLPNENPELDSEGDVVIWYKQSWSN